MICLEPAAADRLGRSGLAGCDLQLELLFIHPFDVIRHHLIDPNTGTEMYESDDIVRYLWDRYGD